jgi:hypothetical protein
MEARIAVFKSFLQRAGLEFDDCSLIVRWKGSDPRFPEGYIAVNFTGDNLTFDVLEKASQLLGTRKIDISCDHGSSSDPCHERLITFWGAVGL